MNSIPVAADERRDRPLWKSLNFQLLWSSTFASGFGDRMMQMAAWAMLGISVTGAQASSIQAGVAFFFFLPYVLFSGLGGWLADTFPRRVILFCCDEARALILLLAVALAPTGAAMAVDGSHYWKIYSLVFAVGCMAAIFSPTRAATIPLLVPVQRLQAANAVVMGMAIIGSLFGLLIGGWLLKRSVHAALLAGSVAFATTGFFFILMRLQVLQRHALGPQPGEFVRMFEAARYVWGKRGLLELVIINILFWAAANIVVAAVTALCKTAYGLPEDQVVNASGLMLACVGAGMLLSSLLVACINTRRESAWVMLLSLGVSGLCIVILAQATNYHAAMVMGFLTGLFGNAAMIVTTTLLQSIAADYIRGRVFGLREVVNTLSAVVVNGAIWQLPDADRRMVPALNVMGAVMIAVAGYGLWTQLMRGPLKSWPLNVLWRLVRFYMLVWHRLRWVGKHNVPHRGAVMLAANHTTGLDPFVMQAPLSRVIRWVMLESFRFRILEPLLWKHIDPISIRQGAGDLGRIRQVISTLTQEHVVGIFPEGSAQRGHRELQPFESGTAMIAVRSGAVIVPVWIEGTPVSQNMLWHFLLPSHTVVVYGKPYLPNRELSYAEIAADLRRRVEELGRTWRNTDAVEASPSPSIREQTPSTVDG